jgi:hypothetical protein
MPIHSSASTWRRLAPTIAILALAVAITAITATTAAATQFHPTCRSGRTLFHTPAVRAFHVSFYENDVKGQHQEILACVPRWHKPFVLDDPGPFNAVQADDFHIIGDRLGFVTYDEGFANGSETDIGWFNLVTGHVRFGLLNAGVNADKHDPLLPDDPVAYTIAPDGTTAVITGHPCQVVAVLPVRTNVPKFGYGLGPVSVLFTAPTGGLAPASLEITPTDVTWQTLTGTPGSAPLSGPSITTSQTGGC